MYIKKYIKKLFRPIYASFAWRNAKTINDELNKTLPVILNEELNKISSLYFKKFPENALEKKHAISDEQLSIFNEFQKRAQNARNWRDYSSDHFMKALFEHREAFCEIHDMLSDKKSKDIFDWMVGYRFLVPVLGGTTLWSTFEPAPFYKIFPGPLSVENFHKEIQETKERLDKLPSEGSNLYAMWHTFIAEQYSLHGICEAELGDVVFDIGGNNGDTAVYFSDKIGHAGKIYVFEPDKEMIGYAKKNLEKFNVDNASLIEMAVSDKSGMLYFSSSTVSDIPVEGAKEVKSVTIDDFVEQNHIEKLDFLKMDIEGGERNALLGARNTIADLRPKMAISIYHKGEKGYYDFYTLPLLIKELCPNYRFYLSHKNAELWETILFCAPC